MGVVTGGHRLRPRHQSLNQADVELGLAARLQDGVVEPLLGVSDQVARHHIYDVTLFVGPGAPVHKEGQVRVLLRAGPAGDRDRAPPGKVVPQVQA